MLTQRADAIARFTRNDAVRFAIAAGILIAVLTAILGSEILPQPTLTAAVGDLATKEEAEIAILAEYLPQALTEAEIAALVDEAVAATGADSARDMGKVMGWLSPRTRGRADGKHVSELVVQALAEADLAAHDVGTH